AVDLAFDDAVEAAVEQFVQSRDDQLRQVQEAHAAEKALAEQKLRRHAEALLEADRRKNEFLATLAHELRNPLAPLRNGLDVMRLAGDSPAAVAQMRELMERQVHQLTRLVDDLLDVARIAQGKLVLRRERFDLRRAVEQAAQMNAPLREARRHTLAL